MGAGGFPIRSMYLEYAATTIVLMVGTCSDDARTMLRPAREGGGVLTIFGMDWGRICVFPFFL